MGVQQDSNNSGLHLVLGLSLNPNETTINHHSISMKNYSSNEPSLTLGLSSESTYCTNNQAHSNSVVSSFSSGRVLQQVKRERDFSYEEVEEERVNSSRVSDEDEDATNARKKLRLTKQQSLLLEESFKLHSTLNPVINYILFSN